MSRFISFAWFREKLKAKQTYRFRFFLNPSQTKKINKSQFLFNFVHLFYNLSVLSFLTKSSYSLLPLKKIRPEKLWLPPYIRFFKQLTFPLIGKRKDYYRTPRACKPICKKSSKLKELGHKDKSSTILIKAFASMHNFPLHQKCKTSSNFQ